MGYQGEKGFHYIRFNNSGLTSNYGSKQKNHLLDWTSPPTESVINFLRAYQQVGGTVTFNLFCYQDGCIFPSDFEIMKKVKHILYG